jgi:hypothetical protein
MNVFSLTDIAYLQRKKLIIAGAVSFNAGASLRN